MDGIRVIDARLLLALSFAVILGLTFADMPAKETRARRKVSDPATFRQSLLVLRILVALQCSLDKCGELSGPVQVECMDQNRQKAHHRNASETEGARTKRWQDSDPLQPCIAAKCRGQNGAMFYQCVYQQCISKSSRSDEH